MLSTPKSRGDLFLASSLRDGLEDNDIRQVETLLSTKYADPNVIIPSHGVAPFHLIIGNESLQFADRVTKLFLRHGGDPNVKSADGLTPVHIAAAWGRIDILELLLANGGDPLCPDNEGRTPFHYAFDGSYYHAISILGKYCGMSCDEEEEEETNYKLTLDKIFVNNGNVVAEYVPSDDSREISVKSEFPKDTSHEQQVSMTSTLNRAPCSSKESETDSHWSRSNNVTVRRYKKRSSPIKFPEISDECNIEDEKILVDEIIRRLSNTLLDDATPVKNETTIIEKNNCETKKTSVMKKADVTKMKFRRLLLGDTSIISKSPNCKISTIYDKTPKNNMAASRICSTSCKKNANDKSSSLKSSKTPKTRVESASSTPKKNRYNGRLYRSAKLSSKCEKIGKYLANDAESVSPKFSNETRDEAGKIVEYSPDTVITVPRRIKRNDHAKNIAVKLDDFMYEDNPEDHDDARSKSHSDHEKPLAIKLEMENGEKQTASQSEGKQIDNSENDEARNCSRVFESPGSSNPLSVCSFPRKRDGTLNDSQDEEETKILLEIDEALKEKCSTPPAAVSMLEDDCDVEKKEEYFHSDYSSGDSTSFCEFYEADPGTMSFWSRHRSFVSVDEEYTYEDQEKGVTFIERHLRRIPTSANGNMDEAKDEDSWIGRLGELSIALSEGSNSSPSSSVMAKTTALNNDRLLRDRLVALGQMPGPITKTTFNVYLKRLWRLEHAREKNDEIPGTTRVDKTVKDHCLPASHVPDELLIIDWTTKLEFYRNLEEKAFKEYAMANPTRKYRGGVSKNSFCYLLLDPRMTKDLPRNGFDLAIDARWKRFLEAVFYVGQGKAARPVAHLYDAFNVWNKKQETREKKIRRILDIWKSGHGVVCLHVFSHTMTEEAHSREASMIEALGTSHLTNRNQGTYYGYATTMNPMEKRSLGKYLLYKSMEILMHDGERQLFPRNSIL